ncbi:translocation/assembly module TamB domain-containing protein [Litorisediminicola beolgyonensis]|uniref:Translocation/assembly module TamB domain-containing protein n=1 Tax=Litorisediminicola beolgyonensis TaxID=1173614 RepID=A0ABW3ZFY1_9RHOB
MITRPRVLAATAALTLLPVGLIAQSESEEERDRGYLQGLLEDNLSGAGRQVRIEGFAGALSSEATIESMTIADGEGVWLTIRGITLDWNRSALLTGRVSVNEFSAEEVLLPRLPAPGESEEIAVPDAEAQPFSLPELPVSIQIGELAVGRVELGAPILGEAAAFAIEGSASLADGEGDANIAANRIDGEDGTFQIDGSFQNETRELALNILLDEGPGGIAATLIGLPGEPALELAVEGTGPISDYTADIRLATDGQDRLTGQVEVAETAEEGAEGTSFTAALAGDIRPLLMPEARGFFGENLSLDLAGLTLSTGEVFVDTLELQSEAIQLSGNLALGPDKWPVRFALDGQMQGENGAAVQLPIPGAPTLVDNAIIDIGYDSDVDDAWSAVIDVTGLDRPDLVARSLRIDGDGTLQRGTGSGVGAVSGGFDIAAQGLRFTDPGLADAAGDGANGRITFSYTEDQPLEISELSLDAAGVTLNGALSVEGLTGELGIDVSGDVALAARDISRFSGLAGRELAGSVDVTASGSFQPLSSGFDGRVEGTANDLLTGIAELDGLLDGQTRIVADARRDSDGLLIRTVDLEAEDADAHIEGRIASDAGEVIFDLAVAEASDILPQLSGAVAAEGRAVLTPAPPANPDTPNAAPEPDRWDITATASAPGGVAADVDAAVEILAGVLSVVSASGTVSAEDVAPYGTFANRPLQGGVNLTGEGRYDLLSKDFAADLDGTTTDIGFGIPELTRLLVGRTELGLTVIKRGAGLQLDRLTLDAERAEIDATAQLLGQTGQAQFDIALSDLADVAEGLSGSARLTGSASQTGDLWTYDVAGSGPGGAAIDLAGQATVEGTTPRSVSAEGSVAVDDLSVYETVARRPMGGSARLSGLGSVDLTTYAFTADLTGQTVDIETGIPELTRLLEGSTDLTVDAEMTAEKAITVETLTLSGQRITVAGDGRYGTGDGRARFDVALSDLAYVVPGLTGALRLNGTAEQSGETWSYDVAGSAPGGAEIDLEGEARVDGTTPLSVSAAGRAAIETLAPYSNLLGRDLAGGLTLEGSGSYDLETGAASVDLTGRADDLKTGIVQADRLLAGTVLLDVDAQLDGAGGIIIDTLDVDAPRVTVTASGDLADTSGDARFDVRLSDLADLVPGMSGSATLTGTATRAGDRITADVTASGPGGLAADLDVAAALAENALESIGAEGTVRIDSLAPYGGLANMPLSGAVSVDGGGSYTLATGAFSADADIRAQSLRTGIAPVDQLFGGTTTATVDAGRDDSGVFRISNLVVDSPELDATVSGAYGGNGETIRFDARLRDLGLFVADLSGPATAQGTATAQGSSWLIDADLTAPGGTTASVGGSVAQDASSANLSITGGAPLGFANPFLEPNLLSGNARFDLALNGPLALSSLSGTVTSGDAEFVIASQAIVLNDIALNVRLGGAQAVLDVAGSVASGGRFSVTGPVGLTAPFNGDLEVLLQNVNVESPGLYQTEFDGQLSLSGPLASTAALTGRIVLEETEVRVPTGGLGAGAIGFALTHVNEPGDVRATRARAGQLDQSGPNGNGGASGGGGGVNYRLGITISAPSRIFVRGRGLDAELGGELFVGGTLQNIIPQGRFDLVRGRLDILGQRLALSEAYIVLQGNFDPFLRVQADTQRNETTVTIIIEGPVSDPEVTFASNPQRPEEEVLALLLFGRDLTEISGLQALRIASAINTLAGRSGTSLVDRLRAQTGLDDLDVQTAADGTTEVRLGKYISERVYTDVTVNGSGETEINLNFTVTNSITARGTVSSDGNTGVGVYYERDY